MRSTQEQIEPGVMLDWLVMKFSEWLEVEPSEFDPRQPVATYGLDSITAVTLSVDLEDALGVELQTALLWDHPTLEDLANYLSEELGRQGVASLPPLQHA
jgi:acyl carrier protein